MQKSLITDIKLHRDAEKPVHEPKPVFGTIRIDPVPVDNFPIKEE
jgi:hypothetical protein